MLIETLGNQAPDIWGEIVPAYLGGVGGVLAGGVAAWALVRDISTRRGLAEVAKAANDLESPSRNAAIIAAGDDFEFLNFARTSMFRNASASGITVQGIRDLTPGVRFTAEKPLPTVLKPRQGVSIRVKRSVGAAAVGTLEVTWTDPQGETLKSEFFA
ncbi:hypothetical protein [Microbacterium enclense]|uniref:hypothetical protein n=1 Tax=Microbacterium enclense TaxID=993073 RepID=UPI000FE34AE9|nr:hypothetical protein [Microbacterium enclense]